MDLMQRKNESYPSYVCMLFHAIVDYDYEKSRELIKDHPQLINICALYHKPNNFCEKITPVHLAALEGNSVALEQLLVVSPQAINAVAEHGNTPLHLASNERIAQLLLDNGAREVVNQHNNAGNTPLYEALYGKHHEEPYFDVARYLLRYTDVCDEKLPDKQIVLRAVNYKNISYLSDQLLISNRTDYRAAFDSVLQTKKSLFIASFIDTLAKRFFENKLDYKSEQFFIEELFYWDGIADQGRQHYFLKTVRERPDKCSFFLKRGMKINYKNKDGISPLLYAIYPWIKKSWNDVPSLHKYNICALLTHGAAVTKSMLQKSNGYLKKLLRKQYETQLCFMCFENADDLSDIPCPKQHSKLVCSTCYSLFAQCPLCFNS